MESRLRTSFPLDLGRSGTSAHPAIEADAEMVLISPTGISFVRSGVDAKNATTDEHINGGSEQLQANVPDFLVGIPELPTPRESFIALAKWRGRVVEVNGQTFRATLRSVAAEEPEKEAEIYVEDISLEDRRLIKKGATFYWSVGYLDRPAGRIRASIFRFSRVPRWSSRDIDRAKAQAESYLALFNDATPLDSTSSR